MLFEMRPVSITLLKKKCKFNQLHTECSKQFPDCDGGEKVQSAISKSHTFPFGRHFQSHASSKMKQTKRKVAQNVTQNK
jgi:hypothetical protein